MRAERHNRHIVSGQVAGWSTCFDVSCSLFLLVAGCGPGFIALQLLRPVSVAAEEARAGPRCHCSVPSARAPLSPVERRWSEDGAPEPSPMGLPSNSPSRLEGPSTGWFTAAKPPLVALFREAKKGVYCRATSARLLWLQFSPVAWKRSGSLCPSFTADRLCTCRRPRCCFDF